MNWKRGSVSLIILTALLPFKLQGADPPKITTLKQLEKTWRHEVGQIKQFVKGGPSTYSVMDGLIMKNATPEFIAAQTQRITRLPLKHFEGTYKDRDRWEFPACLRVVLLWHHLLNKNEADIRAIIENCCPGRCAKILTEHLLALYSLKYFEMLFDIYWKTKRPEIKDRMVWMLRRAAPKGTKWNPKQIEYFNRPFRDKKAQQEFEQRIADTDSFVREFQAWYKKNKPNLKRDDSYSAIRPTIDAPLFNLKQKTDEN